MNKLHVFVLTVAATMTSDLLLAQGSDASSFKVNSLDLAAPKLASGQSVPTTLASSGDGLCWGDPSPTNRVITGEFGEMFGHAKVPHAGVDFRAEAGSPLYAVADGCVAFGNPTPRQLVGVKMRINDKFPNSSVWYLHLSRVVPKFINDGRAGVCTPIRKGELVGFSGNFYGKNGVEPSSGIGSAHLHLSYFVSGVQINPTPYIGAPLNIPAEYNRVKLISEITADVTGGSGTVVDNNSSYTRGSTRGFGVPRMCNVFTVKGNGARTIPFNPNFGVGSYSASATAPSQASLDDGKQRVRQTMGIDANGRGSGTIEETKHWTGGMPEEPDWSSYKDMSFDQLLQSEVSRRTSDTRWVEQLTEQSDRGLAIERAWIKALSLKVKAEVAMSKQRREAQLAALLAVRARRISDGLAQTYPVTKTNTTVR